jgi:hypothetical protein
MPHGRFDAGAKTPAECSELSEIAATAALFSRAARAGLWQRLWAMTTGAARPEF